MLDSRLPKQLFYGELSAGKCSVRGQKKIYTDSLKVSVKNFGMCDNTWEILAKNRSVWQAGITIGAHSAEARRLDEAENKRAARKARAISISILGSEHTCRPVGKTVLLGSDSSVTSALIAHSALRTKLKLWSSSITMVEHHVCIQNPHFRPRCHKNPCKY